MIEHQHQATDDTISIVEVRATGTHQGELMGMPPTGKRVELVGCSVIEVRGDRIVREGDYWNMLTMHQQLQAAD